MKHPAPLLRAALLLPALLLVGSPSVRAEDGPNFVEKALEGLQLGTPYQTREVIFIPIYRATDGPKIDILANAYTKYTDFVEPEFPAQRWNVEVQNTGASPALILGGTVLQGGERDRMVRRDSLVPSNAGTEIRTVPASAASDRRKEPVPFDVSSYMATSYLRKRAEFGSSSSLVPRFVSHFLEFRNEGDDRDSLAAINESTLLAQYCLACHQSLTTFPKPAEGRHVVGFIAAVRGRIQALDLFGNNLLLQRNFERILPGHTFAAAALEIRARKAGIPIPGKDDPEKTLEIVMSDAQELLDSLARSRYREDDLPDGEIGDALLIRTLGGTRGRALGLDGELVHLAVFPHDPFESALFSKSVEPTPGDLEDDPEREGYAELVRRGAMPGRRLTEAEKRLLDRLGRRPGIGSGGPGTGGLGGGGPGTGGLGGGRRR